MMPGLQYHGTEIMSPTFPLKLPGNFQMELITFAMALTRTKFSEAKLQHFYSYLPNAKFTLLRHFGVRMNAMFGNMYVREQFFPPHTQVDEKPILNDKWPHNICNGCSGFK
jgi:hypothetical protein